MAALAGTERADTRYRQRQMNRRRGGGGEGGEITKRVESSAERGAGAAESEVHSFSFCPVASALLCLLLICFSSILAALASSSLRTHLSTSLALCTVGANGRQDQHFYLQFVIIFIYYFLTFILCTF